MPLLGGLLVLALSLLAAFFIGRADRDIKREQAERAAARVESRIATQTKLLDAALGLFQAEGEPTREEFQAFLAAIDLKTNAPGMQGVGYARAEEGTNPQTTRLIEQHYEVTRSSWPQSDQKARFPIVLLEPADARNRVALGYDMYTNPVRRAAMDKAAACNCTIASDTVELVQEITDSKQSGFLVYKPYFSGTGDNKRLRGFIYAPFRVNDLLDQVLTDERNQGIEMQVLSGPNGSGQLLSQHSITGAYDRFPLEIAGKEWTLDVRIPEVNWTLRAGMLTMILGALLAPLVAFLIWAQARRAEIARDLAAERDKRADSERLMLEEMAHRQKNAMARVNSLISLTSRETDDVEAFKEILEGRVAALAAAQKQLLTGGDAGELKAMIHEEVSRTGFSKGVVIEGPAVAVTERLSQPLALTFHEMVTNSVKYGALKQRGMLAISWQTATNADGKPCVQLHWNESGLEGTPDDGKEGFGTRLIRSLIERQLKGKFVRTAEQGRLVTLIEWPQVG